jgi:hypothetical protein
MDIHYLIDTNGHTDGVVVQAWLWQRILDCLKKSPESAAVLKDIPKPPAAVQERVSNRPENPLTALLKSDFIGCFEAEPDLSVNYKAEVGKILDKKYDYR